MKASEFVFEKWSQKYKSSINCNHPKGFSQKAHCAGKNKQNESVEMEMVCEDCGMCETHGNPMMEIKQRLDAKCWTGKKIGNPKTKIKGGIRVNNCVPAESVEEDLSRRGFLKGVGAAAVAGAAGNAKAQYIDSNFSYKQIDSLIASSLILYHYTKNWEGKENIARDIFTKIAEYIILDPTRKQIILQFSQQIAKSINEKQQTDPDIHDIQRNNSLKHIDDLNKKWGFILNKLKSGQKPANESVEQGVAEELSEEFDLIESIIEGIAAQNGVDAEVVWEDLESLTEDELYAFAVTSQLNEDLQKANNRDRTAGMSQKAVNAYRRENPGSKLKTAVTTKPSKLKRGSKASKRRKSYCSRSRGQMKMHNISCAKTPDKAICKARRRWNC